jgi:hypothetical protein
MCPAAIYGYSSAGKTVFLGLLYAAQVRYTNLDRGTTFRFWGNTSTVRHMGGILTAMRRGFFPPANLKEDITEIRFKFGYPRAMNKFLPDYIVKQNWFHPFSTISFAAYDVAGEDVEEYVETGVTENRRVIQELLKSTIIVFIVDCSRFTLGNTGVQFEKMLDYDENGAVLLSALAAHKSQDFVNKTKAKMKASAPVVYPVIILSKFDQIQPEVLNKLGLPLQPPVATATKERVAYGETLLKNFLPQMLALLKGNRLVDVNFDQTAYFFSWVETEKVADMNVAGKPVVARDQQGDPMFSFDEYKGFIEYFRYLAEKAPDDVEEEKAITMPTQTQSPG